MKKNPLQMALNFASTKMKDVEETFKATKKARKNLEKQLVKELEENVDYLNLVNDEKQLKKSKKDLTEQLSDIKHQKELMMRNLDSYEDLEGFILKTEEDYNTKRDEILTNLSGKLSAEGIVGELSTKKGHVVVMV